MNKIITALDYAHRENARTVKERVSRLASKRKLKLVDQEADHYVFAEINAGRWIAICPDCGGAEAVSPEEPLFFCLSCGNSQLGGFYRQVIFPDDYKEIEQAILKRKIKLGAGRDQIEQTVHGTPISLPRAWSARETLDEIKNQNRKAGVN